MDPKMLSPPPPRPRDGTPDDGLDDALGLADLNVYEPEALPGLRGPDRGWVRWKTNDGTAIWLLRSDRRDPSSDVPTESSAPVRREGRPPPRDRSLPSSLVGERRGGGDPGGMPYRRPAGEAGGTPSFRAGGVLSQDRTRVGCVQWGNAAAVPGSPAPRRSEPPATPRRPARGPGDGGDDGSPPREPPPRERMSSKSPIATSRAFPPGSSGWEVWTSSRSSSRSSANWRSESDHSVLLPGLVRRYSGLVVERFGEHHFRSSAPMTNKCDEDEGTRTRDTSPH